MIATLTLSDIAARLNAELFFGDCEFSQVNTDSRSLSSGELFVALKGEHFDAHQFLSSVQAAGACGLVVEQENKQLALPQLKVADTTLALGQIGRISREGFRGKVAAITGSSGKTTVKELLASILSQIGKVHATRGNLNNQFGVPLTLLAMKPGQDFLVAELGASAAGEIAYLVDLVLPDVVMVNNVMPAHIEGFGSLEGVAAAKSEIYTALKPEGRAVVNLDEPFSNTWLQSLPEDQVISFSIKNAGAHFFAHAIEYADGTLSFILRSPLGEVSVNLSLLGVHNVANALAACACAYAMGATLPDMQLGLQAYQSMPGRMHRTPSECGATVIDDTYNANPGAVRAAIDVLVGLSADATLVLGDLGELGAESVSLHCALGRYAREQGVAHLITVGTLSADASKTFGDGGKHFDEQQKAIEFLQATLSASDVVLVKGSRSAHMELVVQAITQRGENA